MAPASLLAGSALVLLACIAAAQEPCFQVLSQRFGGHASLSLWEGEGFHACTRLISPKWHYSEDDETGLAGSGMAHILTEDGKVVCSGAVVSKRVVLTAAGCAEDAGAVEVGGERFVVSEVRLKLSIPFSKSRQRDIAALLLSSRTRKQVRVDPRDGPEGLALLLLEKAVPTRPIPLGDSSPLTPHPSPLTPYPSPPTPHS